MLKEQRALAEYVERYHANRPHQGLDNRVIDSVGADASSVGPAGCSERLGGVLRHYRRAA